MYKEAADTSPIFYEETAIAILMIVIMAVTLRGQHPTTIPYITSTEHGDDREGHFGPQILNRFSELTTTELPVKEGKQFIWVVILLSLSIFQHINDAS